VLVEPGGQVWIDVWLPPGDDLLEADVGRSFAWLGEVWRRALADHGLVATPHCGGLDTCRWGRVVCFGGVGPGELSIGGHKVVGLAQRRGRHGARFQCSALLRWDPDALVALLRVSDDERATMAADLRQAAAPLPAPAEELVTSFLAHLPA
jgi:lipoate-protein ligase A